MEKEIEAAVQWWTQQLRGLPVQNTDDTDNDLFVSVASFCAGLAPLSDEQVANFENALREGITVLVEKAGYDYSDPTHGLHDRLVSVDYDPDTTLTRAAKQAGIDGLMFRFPMKTVMWINPGYVHVRPGKGAQEIMLYPEQEAKVG